MVILELRFPGGRFHATPWDAHVNEGQVEWPPSPYRILRALLSTAFMRVGTVDDSTLRRLIGKLAAEAPCFELPRGTQGHTRQFAPSLARAGGEWKREKLFDAFVHVETDGVMRIVYRNTELDDAERTLLASIVERMTYLGRAESWVDVRLGDSWDGTVDAWPAEDGDEQGGSDVLRLLTPCSDAAVAELRARLVEQRRSALIARLEAKASSGKKPAAPSKAQLAKLSLGLPESTFDVLLLDPEALRADGWARPPGTEWCTYRRRSDVFEVQRSRRARSKGIAAPALARFALDSAVLPRFVDALSVAERVHQTLAKSESPILFGKDASGAPMRGHGHAHVLLEADAQGRIDGVTLYFRDGLDDDAIRGLERLRRVWGHGGHDLHLVHLDIQSVAEASRARADEGRSSYLGTSRIWESRTPFVGTRHPKTSRTGAPKLDADGLQLGSPEHDLRRLLALRGIPEPRRVEALFETRIGGRPTRWLGFRTERMHGEGRRGPVLPCGFRLVFDEAVSGPIVVGYGAHFGLGAFVPVDDAALGIPLARAGAAE